MTTSTPTAPQAQGVASYQDAQLVAALQGHAQWLRNYAENPSRYFKPSIPPEILERAATLLSRTRPPADEDFERTCIKIEKRLCGALMKQWSPSGMSVETLAFEAANEIERLRQTRPPAGAEGEVARFEEQALIVEEFLGDAENFELADDSTVDPTPASKALDEMRRLFVATLPSADVEEEKKAARALAQIWRDDAFTKAADIVRRYLGTNGQYIITDILALKSEAAALPSAEQARIDALGECLDIAKDYAERTRTDAATAIESRIRGLLVAASSAAIDRKRTTSAEQAREAIDALLTTAPILTAEQREQLTSGIGTILPSSEVFSVGWQSALGHVRRELAAIRQRKGS